jgi:hypothetical protein
MRKKILLMLSAFCFMGATVFGQAIEGGAGIIHVTGDPNDNLLLNTVTENEGNIAYDDVNQIAYFYNPGGTAYDGITTGTRWTPIDISGLVDPITSIVVDAAGSPELTATTVGGVTTLSFVSDATITYVPASNTLTFTDVDGDGTSVDLSDLLTPVSAADPSITVTNEGTATNPDYEIGLTGAAVGGNAGMVPVTDGAGNLTWTNVVENVTVSTDGQVMLTFTDSATPVAIDMSNIPEAANITELNGFATALGAGETGLVRAADNNTFGMPATSAVGVLFFISN